MLVLNVLTLRMIGMGAEITSRLPIHDGNAPNNSWFDYNFVCSSFSTFE
jgi:hypothetical protein